MDAELLAVARRLALQMRAEQRKDDLKAIEEWIDGSPLNYERLTLERMMKRLMKRPLVEVPWR